MFELSTVVLALKKWWSFQGAALLFLVSATVPVSAQNRPEISVSAESFGPRFTSNAFLSEKNTKSDFFVTPNYSIALDGKITSQLSYNIGSSLTNTRYHKFSELNDENSDAGGSLSYAVGPWTLRAAYSHTWVFAPEFDHLTAEIDDWTAQVMGKFTHDDMTVRPNLSVRRRYSSVATAENTNYGVGVKFSWLLNADNTIIIAPGASYKDYDVSPIVQKSRKDTFVGLTLEYDWQINPYSKFVFATSVGHNESSIDGRSWTSLGASPTLSFSTKF